ncbi:hypothetical protein [Amycolatopsis sp. MEPSY49]|uniref:hypothetical protein n=1 Tax=Amycolatopsis sp. MEPSY49 TaxID=3151600 RepID=UPI003EF1EF25
MEVPRGGGEEPADDGEQPVELPGRTEPEYPDRETVWVVVRPQWSEQDERAEQEQGRHVRVAVGAGARSAIMTP